jgi:hypothetical protein
MGAVEMPRPSERELALDKRLFEAIRDHLTQPCRDMVEHGELVSEAQEALEGNLRALAMYALDWE